MSVTFATKEATVACLISLGFTAVEGDDRYYDSQTGDDWFPIVQAHVYQCSNGYYCVSLDGDYDWSAPVVWNGPVADWDTTNTTTEFTEWLDRYYPGWK